MDARRCVARRGVAEIVDARVELVDHLSERHDVQHALTLAQEVDELVARRGRAPSRAVEHEARGREVVAEVLAEVLDRLAAAAWS